MRSAAASAALDARAIVVGAVATFEDCCSVVKPNYESHLHTIAEKGLPQLRPRRPSVRSSVESTDSSLTSPEAHDIVFCIRKLGVSTQPAPPVSAVLSGITKNCFNFSIDLRCHIGRPPRPFVHV